MKRRDFLTSAIAVAALPRIAAAQGVPRAARIGWLTAQNESSLTPYLAAMRTGFADMGYIEGRNLAIEYRFANDAVERVPELAAELVKIPVDIIIAQGAAVSEISKLGLRIPVVYIFSADPVSAGLADSLARPRGNMTGLTFMAAELNGKRLEMLRDINPDLRRVAIVANSEHRGVHLERANPRRLDGGWAWRSSITRHLPVTSSMRLLQPWLRNRLRPSRCSRMALRFKIVSASSTSPRTIARP
jgi:putative ABC transport system substrate-binding protein